MRFSKEMDEMLVHVESGLVVGRPSCGKSYMIKLYSEIVNAEVRAEKEKGRVNSGKLVRLEPIDISLFGFNNSYIKSQVRVLQEKYEQQ